MANRVSYKAIATEQSRELEQMRAQLAALQASQDMQEPIITLDTPITPSAKPAKAATTEPVTCKNPDAPPTRKQVGCLYYALRDQGIDAKTFGLISKSTRGQVSDWITRIKAGDAKATSEVQDAIGTEQPAKSKPAKQPAKRAAAKKTAPAVAVAASTLAGSADLETRLGMIEQGLAILLKGAA